MDINNRQTGKDATKPRSLGLLVHSEEVFKINRSSESGQIHSFTDGYLAWKVGQNTAYLDTLVSTIRAYASPKRGMNQVSRKVCDTK